MTKKFDQAFPPELLAFDRSTKIAYFHNVTIAHPYLRRAKDQLLNAIEDADPDSLIFVYGPTGVGKSTLRATVANTIIKNMLPELEVDRVRIPLVSFELVAPGLTSFNWIDNFKRVLCSMDEPLVDFKSAPGTARYQGRSEISDAADLRSAY